MQNIKTRKKKQIEIGSIKTYSISNVSKAFVAVFSGTPHSMGKYKDHYLVDGQLLMISDKNIVLRGKMNGIVHEWYITPR